MKTPKHTPDDAEAGEALQDAIDEVLQAGFATLDQALDATASARSDGTVRSTPDWIDVIKAAAKTDLASLRAKVPAWRGSPWNCKAHAPPQVGGRIFLDLTCVMGWHDRAYQACVAAYHLLEAERNFLKADIYRVWKKMRREMDSHKGWKGRSRLNAFDWYVVIVDELIATKCKQRRAKVQAAGGAQ